MLKTILIDDERSALETLESDLTNHCSLEVEVIKKCQTPAEGLQAIKQLNPDLVFLDVQMPEMNGFELLKLLDEIDFHVVFVTVFDKYARQAFEISAVHYLVKPVVPSMLIDAVSRVQKLKKKDSTKHLQILIENLQSQQKIHKVAIKTSDGYIFVPMQDIMYCRTDMGYTEFYFSSSNRLVSPIPLKDVQKILSPELFFRIHNSNIINRNFINKLQKGETYIVQMQDGEEFSVARSKRKEFLRWLGMIY